MPIYATGTSGTIGRHLKSQVIPLNLELSLDTIQTEGYSFQHGDFLLHLAGVVGTGKVDEDIKTSYAVNVSSSVQLGKKFIGTNGNKFVYVSTSHVYEQSLDPIKETHSVNPGTNYARQKREAEAALLNLFASDPNRLCIVRVFSVLDWDVAPFTLGGGIAQLSDPNSNYVLKFCDDIRDFLTPKTIAQTLLEICRSERLFGVVNLSSGHGISVGKAAEEMLRQKGFRGKNSRMVGGNSPNPVLIGDNSKLTNALPNLVLKWEPSAPRDQW
jgi:nucleoside-diphosphate-sugar epimerase